ncbi:NUDIX hydrolase [Nocardioides sp.]|uniref:NUDIX hydrolase n=1 Tax=Nocardioides sp. TaxID=35761 RepID=UPI00273714C3|nr:NUDIX hydrolase [Nocardioides sp.]MDP3892447.1 NUDIX hydrolase [Nocardioides sp.]
MDATRLLPAHMLDQVRAFATGERTPTEPRNAATIVLVRDGASSSPGALEVYLLRRHLDMAFAGVMAVFPGGGVDPRDFDAEISWTGPSPTDWASLLGCEESLARALVCAAVRETFEESGVLFAGESADALVEDTSGEDWEADRVALEARELAFTDFLSRRGLTLRTDLLRLWGTWVTPVFEPRRYDTRFFVAAIPPGQVTRDVSTESESVTWMPVAEAIAAVDDQQMLMLPPQYCTCMELHAATSAAEAVAAADERDVRPFLPEVLLDGDRAELTTPRHFQSLYEEIHRS